MCIHAREFVDLPMYLTNFQFYKLLVHRIMPEISLTTGHSFHDADGVVEMSLGHEIGDDHDLGNTVVAAFLYHLGDADIVVTKNSGDIGQCSGTVLYLQAQEETALRLLHIQYREVSCGCHCQSCRNFHG